VAANEKSFLASVSLGALVFASGSQAADIAARPVYKAPVWSWAGFYVGANVGAASGRGTIADADPSTLTWIGLGTPPGASRKISAIGGLQAGYNWQFNSLVLGVEGDLSIASLNGSITGLGPLIAGGTYSSRLNTLGTIRGRIGWAFDRFLVYGTGGVAFANLRDQYTDLAVTPAATTSSSATGWTAGAGFEYALTDHWTAKAEYLHVGFPSRTGTTLVGGAPYAFAFKDSLDIGRVGINYKF